MPLPLIPIAIAIGSVIAGGLGIKKGLDAKSNFDEASRINEKVKADAARSKTEQESSYYHMTQALESLGKEKFKIIAERSIARFEKIKGKIRELPVDKFDEYYAVPNETKNFISTVQEYNVSVAEGATGAAAALGSGMLTALGSYGAVTMFATASTGTAISALSGAAASNAAFAALGGGALAAGGFGIAGGMAVLGGAVAAPALLVGGFIFSAKSEKSLEQAKENQAKLTAYKMSVYAACRKYGLIKSATNSVRGILQEMDSFFMKKLSELESVISRNNGNCFYDYSEDDQNFVKNCFIFNQHMCNALNITILDRNGNLLRDANKNIDDFKKALNELKNM